MKLSTRSSILLIGICLLGFSTRILFLPAQAAGATLFISPATGTSAVGVNFSVSFRLNSGGVSINAAEGNLAYEPDELEVVSISKSGSIFNIWTQEPVFSNTAGSISFGGGVPSPGFNGSSGLIFTATLRLKKSVSTTLRYVSGSVLANDGQGTNVLAASQSATFSPGVPKPKPTPVPSQVPITLPSPPLISSPTHPVNLVEHPDATLWSNNNDPEFNWRSDPDANSFSYVFNRDPSTVPDTVSEGSLTAKVYSDVEDGIWFFHIRSQNAGGWGSMVHYEVHIDATLPESFDVNIVGGRDIFDPEPEIQFGTKDITSGIDHYIVRLGSAEPRIITPAEAGHPVGLGTLSGGIHAVRVRAYDRAENHREAFAEFTIGTLEPPVITAYAKTISSDEVIFLEGKAIPNITVIVAIERVDGTQRVTREVASDADGSWTFLGKQFRGAGQWRITAQSKNAQGAVSERKAEVAFEILSSVIHIGSYTLTYASAYGMGGSVLSLLSVIVLIAFLHYRKKIKKFHKRVLKEVTEAEYAVRAGFQTLRGDVIEELHTIDALQAMRTLMPEETARREKLLRDLAFIEFQVTKEVQDIEGVLKGYSLSKEDLPPPPPPQ
ncbi:MAG: cohesin domain-containing protein [bacterium]|nr:cohesin domain-containing protein [bacterium]